MEKRHINRNRHLAAAVAAMALGGLAYNADASLQFSLAVDPASNGFVNSGNANITGTSPITLDVIATVTGTSASSFQGIQSADLNFTASGGSIAGTLTGATVAPFSGNASSGGTSSGLFLGSTDTTNVTGWFVAHADNMTSTPSPAPIKTGSVTESFTLGTVTFTPTSGSGSGTVQVAYRNAANGALWFEDAATAAGTGSVPNVVLSAGSDRELTAPNYNNATIGAAVNLNAVVTGVHDHWKQGVNSGNWGATGSWDDGVIPLATEGVTFGTSPGATGAAAVNLEAPHTTTGVTFNSTASNNYTLSGSTLTVGNGTTAGLTVLAGNQTISAPVALSGATTVSVASGTSLSMSSLNQTTASVSKTGAGALNVDKLRTGGVSITGGTVKVTVNDGTSTGRIAHAGTVASLSISGAGSKLDLTNNSLVVQNTTAAAVKSLIASGYGTGVWDGSTGIITTGTPPAGKTAGLGYAQGNDSAITLGGSIAGQSYNAADTIVKYTYYGDANLDGSVDLVDVGAWSLNFTGSGGSTTKTWTQGDWDYDGDVDLVDVGRWSLNFTGSGGGVLGEPFDPSSGLSIGGVSAVPEPASLSLLALGMLPLIRRRRRV